MCRRVGEGVLAVVSSGAIAAWGLLQVSSTSRWALGALGMVCAGSVFVVDDHVRLPSKRSAPILSSQWSATSRVNVLALAPEERKIVSLGSAYRDVPIPNQVELVQDGTASTYLTDFTGSPQALALLTGSLYGMGSSISVNPSVLVVGFGGGHDVWALFLLDELTACGS